MQPATNSGLIIAGFFVFNAGWRRGAASPTLQKQQKIDRLKSDLTSLKAKIDRINDGFTEGAFDVAEFKELKNPLVPQKAALEEQINVLERSKANRLEPLRKWVFEANTANIPVSNDDWLEMKSFLGNVFWHRQRSVTKHSHILAV